MSTESPPINALASRQSLRLRLLALIGVTTAYCSGILPVAADPPEIKIPPAAEHAPRLTPEEQKRVDEAVERGGAYLRRVQVPNGCFLGNDTPPRPNTPQTYPTAFASLPALALLESGIPAKDPAVQ